MIQKEEYLAAYKLVIEYHKQHSKNPVADRKKFLETIGQRESTCDEIAESVAFLKYDLNPIGGREDMFDSMKQNALEQIAETLMKLEEIRKSLCSEDSV